MRIGETRERTLTVCNIMLLMSLCCCVPAQVGARGKDEWGAMFASSMTRSSVGISKMRVKQGSTGLVCYPSYH